MDISENNLARILGNIESKMDHLMASSQKHEESLVRMETTLTKRMDDHDERLRELEVANPIKLGETLKGHDKRLSDLEKTSARAGALAGLGASVLIAGLVEYVKRKIGP